MRPDAEAAGESDLPLLDRIMRFATPGNLFGLPAITVPAGYDSDGLPIGLHFLQQSGDIAGRRRPCLWWCSRATHKPSCPLILAGSKTFYRHSWRSFPGSSA